MVENQTLLVGFGTNQNECYEPLKYSWAGNDLIRDIPSGPVAKTVLPMQGASIKSPVRELDPICCN